MSTTSNSNMYNNISGRNRYAGLISGLDTEQLVKAMTMNTKNRINTQKQKLQTLQWKQESYRSVISKISEFRDKYLKIDSASSIKANKVLKKNTATSSNDKVIKATASAGAVAAKYTIKEASAAKTASLSSKGAVSSGEVRLDFSKAVSGRKYSIDMTLDGVKKSVSFTAGKDADATKESFLNAVNSTFAEVKDKDHKFEFKGDTSDLAFNSGDDNVFHTFSVSGNDGVGLKFETSNKIYSGTSIGSVGFKQALQDTDDGKYAFNINGVDFEFSKDDTISSIVNKVNDSKAGVKLSFSNVSQSFTLESKDTGAGAEINVYQTKGNLLNSILNIDSDKLKPTKADTAKVTYTANASATGELSSVFTDGVKTGFDSGDANAKFTVNVTDNSGVQRTLTLDLSTDLKKDDAPDDGYDNSQVTEAFENAFRMAYVVAGGSNTDFPDSGNIFSYANGKLTVNSPDITIEFEDKFVTAGDEKFSNTKEMNASPSYIAAKGVNTMTFDRNGEEVTVTASSSEGISLQDLIDAKIITLPTDGNMIAAGDISGKDADATKFLKDYFDKEEVLGAKDGEVMTAKGSNSLLTVSSDGETFTTYSSATNLFTFDGTTINLTDAKDFKAESKDDYITVETKKDTSGIKDVVKSFVEDYNKLLEDLYKEINTSRPKKSGAYFDPLTEEQEEEMSDKEIEKWNENAQQGLLYRDNNIQKFLTEIRGVMAKGMEGFTLKDMGVKLTTRWQDNGKLEIDEAKLESAIEAYGDKVADFFTGENGLASRLESTVNKAISTDTKKYGYLSQMAGIEGTKTDKDNSIFKQMEAINKNIERLTTKYENEQERYWKQYTQLEKLMSQMQTMQSYFSDGSM